ncbi:Alpha/Beta hydrolase protein [Mycena galericulata]|nr:Alpha/Beta hydrolase protein [Mycena galericulata]
MTPKTKSLAPFGTWKSPLTVDKITETDNVPDLVDVVVDPITSQVYHIEKRPAEGGRNTLLNTATDSEVTGGDWDVKTTVNGYGGAPAIVYDNVVYFSHVRDGRVYRLDLSEANNAPDAITPENISHKFANFDVYPVHPTLLVCVMEDHTGSKTPSSVVNSLCILDVATKSVSLLESDASFYSSPKFSPDGKRLVWVEWDLPDMPWNGTEIWVADVLATPHSLHLQNPRHVAGEHGKISVAYPSWLSNDTLLFTSDISGFENPWTYDCSTGEAKAIFENPLAESFAYGQPPKKLGWSPYAVANAQGTAAVFTAIRDGRSVLYLVDFSTGKTNLLANPYATIEHIRPLHSGMNQIVFIGTKADAPPALVQCILSSSPTEPVFNLLQSDSHGLTLPREYISLPRPMSLLVPHSAMEKEPVHVVYYAPNNPEYAGLEGEKPPCTKQFFTTRGWAWLDVNYGGSSGYGRAYMERLRGNWGIVDVDDCLAAALTISSAPYNLVDPKRIVIRGPSAGGFTVLSMVSMKADAGVFAAGTSLYGISDLRRLEQDTHKFESGFLRMLVGADPQVMLDRSPVSHADKIVAPLLILQGESDTAVPRSQADGIVDSIQKRGGMVEYKLYPGEGHGWKRRDTIEDALRREIRFYNRVLAIPSDEFN